MSFVLSSHPIHHSEVVNEMLPLPNSSVVKLPISPLCASPSSNFPCFLNVGFQCPPAELPSAALQSDFSWICIAWIPGFKPVKLAVKVTWLFFSVKKPVPWTLLLLFGSNVTFSFDATPFEEFVLQPMITAIMITDRKLFAFLDLKNYLFYCKSFVKFSFIVLGSSFGCFLDIFVYFLNFWNHFKSMIHYINISDFMIYLIIRISFFHYFIIR